MVSRISTRLFRLPVGTIHSACTLSPLRYLLSSTPACWTTVTRTVPPMKPITQRMPMCTNVSPPSSPESKPTESTTKDMDDFKEFFFFPNIRTTRLMVRLKIYQTAMVALPFPIALKLFSTGAISNTTMYMYSAFAVISVGALFAMSYKANRLIGRLALSNDNKIVQISYLDFWGARKEDFVEVENMVPFSELKDSPSDTLMQLLRYDVKSHYYISLRGGGIKDTKRFEHVFGKSY